MADRPRAWADLLAVLLAGRDLSSDDAAWAMGQIMAGDAQPVQLAAFLVALRAKGESVPELRAIADTMLTHARRIQIDGPSLDIVGTGGDRAQTVNISTMAAITAAATGVRVIKHGNRAASSSSGTADVLEALGVNLSLSPDQVVEVARRCGITFCFAQVFHPAMRHAAGVRRELGIPTVFNVLGPLTNPAQPTHSAIGVADPRLAPLVAGVFASRGRSAAVFRGDDGLDEITVATTSQVWWVADGHVQPFVLDPTQFGFELHPLDALRGGSPQHNAEVVRQVFAGERGAVRDAVLLNAGIALATMGSRPVTSPASFVASVQSGIQQAADALDDGRVAAALARWAAVSSSMDQP